MAMRRAAKYGDGWLPIGSNPSYPLDDLEKIREAVKRFHSYAFEAGRSTEELKIGYIVREYNLTNDPMQSKALFAGTAGKIVKTIKEFESIGVTYLGFTLRRDTVEETLEVTEKFVNEIFNAVRK
jgi:alkanesulfonate monooxygenase SsuD/methylene tetrahydromethanopterin reductase-like flavin-dependent oxidoreductase (luciferase family)